MEGAPLEEDFDAFVNILRVRSRENCQSWEQSTNQINSLLVLLILFWCAIKVINVWNMLESVWTVSLMWWEGHGCFFASTCSSLNVPNQSPNKCDGYKKWQKTYLFYVRSMVIRSVWVPSCPSLKQDVLFRLVLPFFGVTWSSRSSSLWLESFSLFLFFSLSFFFFKHCLDWSCTASLFLSICPFLILT